MRPCTGRTIVGGVAVLATVVLIAGCGSAAPPAASQAVEDYFGALGEGRYRTMVGLSTGPARLYAEYLVAGERSVNGPASPPPLEAMELGDAEVEADRVRLSGEARVATVGGDTTFRDFDLMRDGDRWLLHDYLRNGQPLAHFVSPANTKTSAQGLRVAADLAFRDPTAGTLAVPVVITNDRPDDIELVSYEARFRAVGSGRAHRIDFSGPGPLAAGDSIDVILVFDTVDDADDGGQITLTLREAAGDIDFDQPLVVPSFTPE